MDLFEFLAKLDDATDTPYHFTAAHDGRDLTLNLVVDDGSFFARYNVRLLINARGHWEAHGLPDSDDDALFEAYTLAEGHGIRVKNDEYMFSLSDLVDLIAEAR